MSCFGLEVTNSNTILSVPNPGSRNYLSVSYGLLTKIEIAMMYFLLSGLAFNRFLSISSYNSSVIFVETELKNFF